MSQELSLVNPYSKVILTAQALTASANFKFNVPNDCEDFLLIFDVTYTSGTSATLDACFDTSTDLGTTYYMQSRYAQITTASAKRILSFSRRRSDGQAAAEYADATTGGAAANNGPITQFCRLRCTTGGTNPTYTFTLSLIANRINA